MRRPFQEVVLNRRSQPRFPPLVRRIPCSRPGFSRVGNDGVNIDRSRRLHLPRGVCAGVKLKLQGVNRAEHEGKLAAWVTFLHINHPLTADADLIGEGRLVEFELFASVTNSSADVSESANTRAMSGCQCSPTSSYVSDR